MKICPVCSNEFSSLYRPNQVYCSTTCAHRNKTIQGTEIRVCPKCGKDFVCQKKSNQVSCSHACGMKNRRKASKPSRRRPDNFIVITCIQCGNDKRVHKSQNTGDRHRRFCSRRCMGDWMSINKQGHNNPMYKGGHSNDGYGDSWYHQRRAAYLRDNKTCQICGQKRTKKIKIDVHHIKPFRTFDGDHKTANQLKNLITLCRKCHANVEHHGFPCPQRLI